MSIRTMSNYFKKGQEPYCVPTSTQAQVFNYPVSCNDTLQCSKAVSLNAGATCNNDLKMNSGKNVKLYDTTNAFMNLLYTDNKTHGVMINSSIGSNLLPQPNNAAGMGIVWDSDDGSGTTDLINYGQGGAGLGFNLRAVNTNTPCVTVARFWANKLPTFTYGPVCYGFVPSAWDQSKALVLPYFITGGFQIVNTSTGVYQVTFPVK